MAILQTLFILKAQWLTCPDPEYLKSFLHQWLQLESWPRLWKHIDPEPTVWAGPTWTLSSVPLLLIRSGRHNSVPCSCWEPKKRWYISKPLSVPGTAVGLPNAFPIGNHIPYVYANVCVCVCLSIWSFRWVGRTLLEQKKAWYLCSSQHSALPVTVLPNNLSLNIRIQDPFQCHRFSSEPKKDFLPRSINWAPYSLLIKTQMPFCLLFLQAMNSPSQGRRNH